MSKRLRHLLVLCLGTAALLAAPVVMQQSVISPGDIAALAKSSKSNGGNGGGNGGGGGGGSQSKGKSGQSASASQGGGNTNGGGNGRGKKAVAGDDAEVTLASAGAKPRNLRAQLGGLNSLNRNINGLMNSADPRMTEIRAYISASADLAEAQAIAADAAVALGDAQLAYDALLASLGQPAGTTPATLTPLIEALDAQINVDPPPANVADLIIERDELLADQAALESSLELSNLLAAEQAATAAAQDVAELEAVTGEDDLRSALLAAANPNRVQEGYLTDEIMLWASQTLGVGDYDGLIDDYIAGQ